MSPGGPKKIHWCWDASIFKGTVVCAHFGLGAGKEEIAVSEMGSVISVGRMGPPRQRPAAELKCQRQDAGTQNFSRASGVFSDLVCLHLRQG